MERMIPNRSQGRGGARLAALAAVVALAGGMSPTTVSAGIFGREKSPNPVTADAALDALAQAIQLALDEDRHADAGRLIDQAFAAGEQSPRLVLLAGDLNLAKGRYDAALRSYTDAEASPALAARAAEGRGLALSQLGRSDKAMSALRKAVEAEPKLWRAWSALGVEYDKRKDWAAAEIAYGEALKSPKAGAVVHSNLGYSRLLQGRYDEAAAAFVVALQKNPGLSQARTNLRLALAMRGEYGRASAVSGAEDRAALLNNAGFVAMMRGDLAEAEALFNQAIEARGSFYSRAYENLAVVRSLKPVSTTIATP